MIEEDGLRVRISASARHIVRVACPACSATRKVWMRAGGPPLITRECGMCHRYFDIVAETGETKGLSNTGVYFLCCQGFVKVGRCVNLRLRWRELENMNPLPLRLLGFIPTSGTGESDHIERTLHLRFRHLRHRGEWFHDADELRQWITTHAKPPDLFLEDRPSW